MSYNNPKYYVLWCEEVIMVYSIDEILEDISTAGLKGFFSNLPRSKKYSETIEYRKSLHDTKNATEALYLYVNNIPVALKCPCGLNLKFKSYSIGYGLCSNTKCQTRKDAIAARRASTNLEKFGTKTHFNQAKLKVKSNKPC